MFFSNYGLSFVIGMVPFIIIFIKAKGVFHYFHEINNNFPLKFYVWFCFILISCCVIFFSLDVATTSHDKRILSIKEVIGMILLFIFVFDISVCVPVVLLSNKNHLIWYFSFLFGVNAIYLLLSWKNGQVNYGFENEVPEGLAKYAQMDSWIERCFYFNFGIAMALGKFLGFTYMPYGMSKWVSSFFDFTDKEDGSFSSEINGSSESEEENELISSKPIKLPQKKQNKILSSLNTTCGIILTFLIVMIVITKIVILSTKILYNICGIECGLLAYRFDTDVLSLETFLSDLTSISQHSIIKFDFLFYKSLLLFRAYTTINSIKEKGISFLSIQLIPRTQTMNTKSIFLYITVILYTSIVLIYDFTYLLPDYMRFNNLDLLCDYTMINKPYCGVSFFGLIFIKISMNYHLLMLWDILASLIFITNSTIWCFKLIIIPNVKKIQYKYIY